MDVKLLLLGDVCGASALKRLRAALPGYKKANDIFFTVVNGENACIGEGNGITPEAFATLSEAGADVVTSGNHIFAKKSIFPVLESEKTLLRPANYPPDSPGSGDCTLLINGISVRVINLLGIHSLEPPVSPFLAVGNLLKNGSADITLVDFHAEATSEKAVFGHYLDGKVTAVFGTHTHVQTADERILPGGTAFITDIGMCGAEESALGVDIDIVLRRYLTCLPEKFEISQNETVCRGVIVTADTDTGKAKGIVRIRF